MASPLNRHEFDRAPGDGEGGKPGVAVRPWGHKELDGKAERLNNTGDEALEGDEPSK